MKIYRGKKRIYANNRRHTSKRPVMAGAGAGIKIEFDNINVTDASGITVSDFQDITEFNGYATGTINIKSIGTYYTGGDVDIDNIQCEIRLGNVEFDGPDGYAEFQQYGVDGLFEDMYYDNDVIYGSGWTRVTFDGDFDIEAYTDYLTVAVNIKITDARIVEYLDKVAHGEDRTVCYTVFVGHDVYDSYEDREAAIEVAEDLAANPEYEESSIDVFEEEDIELFDGSHDIGDFTMIWSNCL